MYEWSIHYWKVIYSLLSSTNQENIEETKNTIHILCKRVPCGKCLNHYILYIKDHPLKNVKNQKELAFWLKEYKDSIQQKEVKKEVKVGCCKKYDKPKNKLMYF